MHCPFCGAKDTKVTDSRLVGEGGQVRRRRECLDCTERFTTYESAQLIMPRVIKHDRCREPFDEIKLLTGLQKSLEKRPVSTEKIEEIVHRIKRNIRATGEREISSQSLGEMVMNELKQLDHVAYVRFASVYRRFQDINAFREEINHLEKK